MLWLLSIALADEPPDIGVPGRLALSGATYEDTPWGPIKASSSVVTFQPWDVPAGTIVAALDPRGGRSDMTVGAPEDGRHGCDGGSTKKVVPLAGDVGPGMVWLVPSSVDGEGLPVTLEKAEEAWIWSAGEHRIALTRTGEHTAMMSVDGTQLDTFDVSKNLMDGYEAEPLRMDSSFLVPHVSSAWRVGKTVVFGLHWASFEGTHFEVLVLADGAAPKRTELRYLYSCSF
ncbi:MAG: hypothetical protein GY913_14845 [Proteobacteria bacterium]|nr:hypothetical protein [Pseudomonadota bacterium]MCP4918188.1 hypothetical protein [Pseudomonadota bacterium]